MKKTFKRLDFHIWAKCSTIKLIRSNKAIKYENTDFSAFSEGAAIF